MIVYIRYSFCMNNTNPPVPALKIVPKSKKILVVEDEPDARMIFKSLIEVNTSYIVDEATNGTDALTKLEAKDVDLVLLDIIMPEMDGIEVLKTIKENPEKYGNPKIVMLTNLTSEDAEKSSTDYHADGYLTKISVEPDQLVSELNRYLENGNEKIEQNTSLPKAA
jgi:CheY-like chemotaxis protein